MGLVKRGKVWWMSFVHEGRQFRRSTGTTEKRLAEAILAKVKVELIEGRFFERRAEEQHTFMELIERYEQEHASRRASYRRCLTSTKHLKAFFGNLTLNQITPKLIVAYKNKSVTGYGPPRSTERFRS